MDLKTLPESDRRPIQGRTTIPALDAEEPVRLEMLTGRVISWEELKGSRPTQFLFRGEEHGASISIFVVDFSPGQGPPLHRHSYEEVFVVQEGLARFTAGQESLDAEVGQVVVVPARTPHRFVNAGEGRLRVTSVHPRPQVEQEWLET